VPSHSILPDSRRAAIEAVIDEALTEVRGASDVALLHECRAIFRGKVPLSLRAYVAAAFALRLASGGAADQRRGRQRDDVRAEGRGHGAAAVKKPGDNKRPDRNAPDRINPPPKAVSDRKDAPERREPEIRENRYRGEGVTLFVSAGRRQRFYARVAIKQLLDTPGVSSEQVGDIRTMDNYSFIVVDPAVEDTVISALDGLDFKGRILAANRARKKGEPAPAPIGDEQARTASVSAGREPDRETGDGFSGEEAYPDDDDDFDESDLEEFGSGGEETANGNDVNSEGDDTTGNS
jgi:hypothetical protein